MSEPNKEKATSQSEDNISPRAAAINREYHNRAYIIPVRASIDERRVIRAWNRNKYIRSQVALVDRDPRNFPVPFKEIAELLPSVKKVIRTVGASELIRHIEVYLDFCSTGGHIWDGKSHGFKSLPGFLEKVLLLHKTKQKPWWDVRETPVREISDEHSRLTNRIANTFAQTYMNEKLFPLQTGSKEHHHFSQSALLVSRYIERKRHQGIQITQTDMIKYLFEFVTELFDKDGDSIYPAHFSSSAVWAAFPAYLIEKGVI